MKKMKAGWVEGDVSELLGLDDADMEIIETKLALSKALRERRKQAGMTQAELAEKLHTSQSRVSCLEHGDPGSTVDLLLNALFRLGVKREEVFAS
jgi:predicted XRE-type DNA-binding protein